MNETSQFPITADLPLAEAFKLGSAQVHDQVEGSGYIKAILAGQVTRPVHLLYLQSYFHVYRTLENLWSQITIPAVQALHQSALNRQEALEADYAYYSGGSAVPTEVPFPAVTAYCNAMQRLFESWPVGLVAHHYTRYLGDLAGGQMLRQCIARALVPESGLGLNCFEFPHVPDLAACRQDYRQRLNAISLINGERDHLISEVQKAFRYNHAVFAHLEKHP